MMLAVDTPAQIRRLANPVARIKAARQAKAEADDEFDGIIGEAVREMLESGKSLADVADILTAEGMKVTRQRVHQMARLGRGNP
jgi:hypothetical protein